MENKNNLEKTEEEVTSRERICRIIGWTFYVIAALDFILGNFAGIDFTGVWWSPIAFGAIGYLIGRFGGKDNTITWW